MLPNYAPTNEEIDALLRDPGRAIQIFGSRGNIAKSREFLTAYSKISSKDDVGAMYSALGKTLTRNFHYAACIELAEQTTDSYFRYNLLEGAQYGLIKTSQEQNSNALLAWAKENARDDDEDEEDKESFFHDLLDDKTSTLVTCYPHRLSAWLDEVRRIYPDRLLHTLYRIFLTEHQTFLESIAESKDLEVPDITKGDRTRLWVRAAIYLQLMEQGLNYESAKIHYKTHYEYAESCAIWMQKYNISFNQTKRCHELMVKHKLNDNQTAAWVKAGPDVRTYLLECKNVLPADRISPVGTIFEKVWPFLSQTPLSSREFHSLSDKMWAFFKSTKPTAELEKKEPEKRKPDEASHRAAKRPG